MTSIELCRRGVTTSKVIAKDAAGNAHTSSVNVVADCGWPQAMPAALPPAATGGIDSKARAFPGLFS